MARREREPGRRQRVFAFPEWGGARPGAGRKRRSARPQVPHVRRAELAPRFPVHVTMRLRDGLPSLRRSAPYAVVRGALVECLQDRGFRLVVYSVQRDHLHLVVEADGRGSLCRSIQGLSIRIARRLNALWDRAGSVFADRYHDVILRTPRQVRNAVRYVLLNARKHGVASPGIDPYSSGRWFDGWRERIRKGIEESRPVAVARTWLLAVGWRRHGPISCFDVPGSRSR